MEEIQKAINLSPDCAEAHFNIAILAAEGSPAERARVATHYQRAIELGASPDSVLENQLR